ncbi:hypothetical protein GCM10008171_07200 [Methylopila jiangsuensis]|uniref:Ceramide glucosyltransferase n=1 Tax=Methylopila jiangsuensis TaxID=586230 RepID=A0A9W6JDC8_9HYPH|nr:hypothetical protein GCM10008171_07200 [Methylopila jiangsuensis]
MSFTGLFPLFAWATLVCGVLVTLCGALLAWRAWRMAGPPKARRRAQVALILPLTGPVPGFGRLVAALEAQTLRPERLIVAVESLDDPAFGQVRAFEGRTRFALRIVVAGHAVDQAQKCRNQQAALAVLDGSPDVVALMDGDIVPQTWWLSALASPLMDGTADVVIGRRWQQVAGRRLGAHLVAAIDRPLALLPRLSREDASVIWGGSAAFSRAATARMDLRAALDRTLADDLSLADHAAAAGLRVLTRGSLLAPTPASHDVLEAWSFGRRQHQICHIYRPKLWWLALLTIASRLGAFAVGAVVVPGAEGAAAVTVICALSALRQALVGDVGRKLGMPDSVSVRAVQIALGAAQPLVDLFHISVILGAAWTRRVSWGHVDYAVRGRRDIRVAARRSFESPAPMGETLDHPQTW